MVRTLGRQLPTQPDAGAGSTHTRPNANPGPSAEWTLQWYQKSPGFANLIECDCPGSSLGQNQLFLSDEAAWRSIVIRQAQNLEEHRGLPTHTKLLDLEG